MEKNKGMTSIRASLPAFTAPMIYCIIISEDAYNNMLENMHLLGNKANYDWLMESKAQLETGSASVHPLTEVSDE